MYINVSLHIVKFNAFNIFFFDITFKIEIFYIYISTYINLTLGIFHATSQIFMLLFKFTDIHVSFLINPCYFTDVDVSFNTLLYMLILYTLLHIC